MRLRSELGKTPLAASADDLESRLHREIVEIRDAMIDPRVTFDISAAERALLEIAPRATSSDSTRERHGPPLRQEAGRPGRAVRDCDGSRWVPDSLRQARWVV